VRALLLLRALDVPAAADVRARARRGPTTLRVLPDARFSCQGSGSCGSGLALGPVLEADIARISACALEDASLERRFVRVDPTGARFLATTADGACVFLDRHARCGLHARFGPSSKPLFCRLFPLALEVDVDGARLYDDNGCASFSRAGDDSAQPIGDGAGSLVHEAMRAGVLPLVHPLVRAAAGQAAIAVDASLFWPLRDRWVALLDLAASPGAALDALVRETARWQSALAFCAPHADGPDDAVAALETDDPADAPLPAPDPDGLRELAAALAERFTAVGGPPHPSTAPLVAALRAVATGAAPADPHPYALLRRSWRSRLFGSGALVEGRPWAALLRLAVAWRVARVAGSDWDAGHALAARRLEAPLKPLTQLFAQWEARAPGVARAAMS
jgi:Fe-S-cluster containining protein